MQKIIRKTLYTFVILTIFCLVFRSWIYQRLFSYKNIGEKNNIEAQSTYLIDYINEETSGFQPENINDIIEKSLQITSKKLSFEQAKNDIDPNKLIRTENAHCVGYSAFFNTTCSYLLKKYHFSDDWNCKHLVGKIYCMNTDIHPYFKSGFFRDHDFNIIFNKKDPDKTYYTDPTLFDYSRIKYVKGRN